MQPRKLVFVVEDIELMRNMFQALLKRQGFDVICYADPSDMLLRLAFNEKDLPDLILMDYGLNGWKGSEVIREVRILGEPYTTIPILGLSDSHPEAPAAFAAMGVPYLVKTLFDADILLNKCSELMGLET